MEAPVADNRLDVLVGSEGGGPEPLKLAALLRTAADVNGELAAAANWALRSDNIIQVQVHDD